MYNKYCNLFVEEHFQEFYEKYMQLKESTEYSKEDILKIFSEITREDIFFNKIFSNINKMPVNPEEKEKMQEENEYELFMIKGKEDLQQRIEKTISDGILDIEDKLYENIDFKNVTYNELLDRATIIIKENAKIVETNKDSEEQQEDIVQQEILENNSENIKQDSIVFEDAIQSKPRKEFEQPQQEKIKQKEESIKDEIDNEFDSKDKQMQEIKAPTVDLWMDRFNGWYSVIDRA